MLVSRWCFKSGMLNLIGQFCYDVIGCRGSDNLDGLFVLYGRNETKEDKYANQSAVQAKFRSKSVCSIL